MLNIQNLTVGYSKKLVLQDVSFSVPLGKIIGIAGENGSGKSTLLKTIAGLITPKVGQIHLDNKVITRRSTADIAYLPDIDLFHPYFTGEEVFRFYATQFEDFSYDKACIVAQYLDVPLNEKLAKLSKGKRGRVKMAATLGRNVKYYLMDEPFSGLDPMVRESLIKGLLQFTEPEKQTILLSTHEIIEVEPILDALIVLKEGSVLAYEELEFIRDELQQNAVQWMKTLYEKGCGE